MMHFLSHASFLLVAMTTGLMVQAVSEFQFSYVALSSSSVSINFTTPCPKYIDLYVMELGSETCAHHITFDCLDCSPLICSKFTEVFPLPTVCLEKTVLERNRSLDNIIHVLTGLHSDMYAFRFVQHLSNSSYRAKSVAVTLGTTPRPDTTRTVLTRTPRPTMTTTESKPNPISVQQPLKFEFDVPMGVKLNATFDPAFKGEYTRRFKTELARIFINVTGFVDVFEVDVSNGSIQCEFLIKLDGKKIAVPYELMREINETVLRHLEMDGLDGHAVYMDYVRMRLRRLEKDLKLVWADTCPWMQCPQGYQCMNPGITKGFCVHKCDDECMKHGECLLNGYWAAKCRCKDDDDFHYTGENCEIRHEKLDFTWSQILIIGGSVGGSLCLTCFVLMACLCSAKHKRSRDGTRVPSSNASTNSIDKYQPRKVPFGRHGNKMDSDWRSMNSDSTNPTYIYPTPNMVPIVDYITPVSSNGMDETARSRRQRQIQQRPRAQSPHRDSFVSMTSSDTARYMSVLDIDMKASLDSSTSSGYRSYF